MSSRKVYRIANEDHIRAASYFDTLAVSKAVSRLPPFGGQFARDSRQIFLVHLYP